MQRSRNFAIGLVLLVLASVAPLSTSIRAQVPKVTAGEVVDKESLRGFVTWATSEFAAVSSVTDGTRLIQEFRTEGSDWNVGNTYLIIFTVEGQVFLHGEDPYVDGKNVIDVVDDDGTKVIGQMITAGSSEAKYVEWCWDDPLDVTDVRCKDSYAMRYRSLVAGVDFVVVGGYFQDLSYAGEPLPNAPLPDVSAADVVDRESLKQFVEGTVGWFYEIFEQVGFERANEWKRVLRADDGHFKSGSIYLFIFTPEGYVIFHGADPWREGRTVIDNTDFQGRKFVRDVISAAQGGGGFIEYFWDDPTVQGDEDTGSPKVSYAVSVKSDVAAFSGVEFIIGAGFYRNFSTAEAEAAGADWLARFGRSVANQAMEIIGHRVSLSNPREDHMAIGGRSLSVNSFLNPGTLAAMEKYGPSTLFSANRLLGGSSFQVSPGEAANGGGYALWGSGQMTRFGSGVGDEFSDGEVMTAALGADYAFGSIVAGLAMTYSTGAGDFELGRPGKDDAGDISTSLTSAFPYARLAISDRLIAWSVLGYGAGSLNIEGGGEKDPESDISMQMGGIGMRGTLLKSDDPGGLEIGLRSDAMLTRIQSDEVEGRQELTSSVSRIRLSVEAMKAFAMGPSMSLKPEVHAGMRFDGGDVDSGLGMEVGGGVTLTAGEPGLTVHVHGRTLVAHQESGFEEWGIGGSIFFNPGGQGRGLSLGLIPTWGATANGLARLWSQGAAGMMGDAYNRRQVDAEIGYGVETPSGRGLLMPYARLALFQQPVPLHLGSTTLNESLPLQTFDQDAYGYQLGGRLNLAPGLSANVEAGRNAWARGSGPINSATVNVSLFW